MKSLAKVFPRHFTLLLVTLALSSLLLQVHTLAQQPRVCVIHLDMAIDEGAATFIDRAFSDCRGSDLIVIAISSNGGYLTSAQKIITTASSSITPCVSWVPPGSQAYSAATLIAFSCRSLYMGSGSAIGAVTPYPTDNKTVEAVRGLLTSLMVRMLGDREDVRRLAYEMVVKSRTLDDSEAVRLGVARKADSVEDIARVELNTTRISVVDIYPNAWEKLVSLLSNPVVYSVMLAAGVLLIIVEILTTGFQGYGLAGALLIILALYAMSIVPPDLLAVLVLLSGVVLLAIEMIKPVSGALAISGAILTVVGLVMTFRSAPPEIMTPSVYVVSGGLGAIAVLAVLTGLKGAEALRMKRRSIEEELIGAIGVAKTDIGEVQPGVVYVANEEWTAYSIKGSIPQGSKVRVVRVEGLKLYVEKVEEK
jgi:membrane-bound serine protease (ClpP class)